MVLEVCVDSLDSALAAQAGGADRIELCSSLAEGGLTPSLGFLQVVRKHLSIPIMVMIRPRGGDFCYSEVELEAMQQDIQHAKQAGADGVVFGVLNTDGTIAVKATKALIKLAQPLNVTFHRAFDLTRDPLEALQTLMDLGFERVLTSGQAANAFEGLELISRLLEKAGENIIVMPGGRVEAHLEAILKTGVREVHLSGRTRQESPMQFRRTGITMGLDSAEYTRFVSDSERIRQIKKAMTRS